MGVETQGPKGGEYLQIKCDINKSQKKNWTCCNLKEFCAKIKSVSRRSSRTKSGTAVTAPKKLTGKKYKAARTEGNKAAADFREDWINNSGSMTEKDQKKKFYASCAHKAWKDSGKADPKKFQPDHVWDVQYGGPPSNNGNLRWLSKTVNLSIGKTLASYDPKTHPAGVRADCCPASTRCKGKSNDTKLKNT